MGLLGRSDAILRGRAGNGELFQLALLALLWSAAYGATMGTFGGLSGGRALQVVYSGLKVPLLLLVTFGLCLPAFAVLNTLLGLRTDLRQALSALLSGQAALAIVLCSFAPFTALFYLSVANYPAVLLWNGALFALASLAGQVVLRAGYRPLIAREPRHRVMLRAWLIVYVLVAIQMAWVLRPFVGAPGSPVELFRKESWGNAYVVVLRLPGRMLRGGK